MKPKLYVRSSNNDQTLDAITACISNVESSVFFKSLDEKTQIEQGKVVRKFQNKLLISLFDCLPEINWQIEFSPNNERKDSIDIYGQGNGFVVVIELDKHRADQVAKKFVSRIAILPITKIFYISLCYPGTKHMNKKECIKYFDYCANLSARMSNEYAGFIIEKREGNI